MTDMYRIRNWLGFLGMLLPVTLLFFILTFGKGHNPVGVLTSISATYYSSAFIFFVCLVAGVGFFLLFYQGYDIVDRIYCKIAGIGALGLVLFPCTLGTAKTWNAFMWSQSVTNILHIIFAFAFFAALILIIGFQFTKTNKLSFTGRKKKRNILYYTCASTMFAALLVGFGGNFIFGWTYSVFIGEFIALEAFGIAWIIKGGIILKDL